MVLFTMKSVHLSVGWAVTFLGHLYYLLLIIPCNLLCHRMSQIMLQQILQCPPKASLQLILYQ